MKSLVAGAVTAALILLVSFSGHYAYVEYRELTAKVAQNEANVNAIAELLMVLLEMSEDNSGMDI